jgi:hypothetical protein
LRKFWQKNLFPFDDPSFPINRLVTGTMPVTTTVIGNLGVETWFCSDNGFPAGFLPAGMPRAKILYESNSVTFTELF